MAEQARPLQSISFRSFRPQRVFKRAFDILGAAIGLVLLAPVFAFVAWRIKWDSPGPVFYRGRRAAMGGGEFRILKFRTMYEDERSYAGPKVTGDGDPRITPVGHWLRDTKLNELPQLWNVLKGEMSFVGPRPEDPDIVAQWPADVRAEILSMRPGITSPASVLYRNEEKMLQSEQVMETYLKTIAPNKQRLDQLYVRHHSFWLDMDVLMWTLFVLIPQVRNYQPPESMLYRGPMTRFTQRYLNWFVIDLLISFLAFGAAGAIWRTMGPLNVGRIRSLGLAFGFALLFSLVGVLMGTNRIDWARASASDVFDLVPAIAIATLIVFGVNGGVDIFPDGLILVAAFLAAFGFVAVRYRSRLITGFLSRVLRARKSVQAARERVLIVGGGQAGQFAIWLLTSGRTADLFHPVGIVDDDLYKQDARIRGVDVVGRSQDIPALVRQMDVGIIVFAIHNIAAEEKRALLNICRQTQAQVVILPDFLETVEMAHALQGQDGRVPGAVWMPDAVPASQVQTWLREIEQLAEADDTEAVRRYAAQIRAELDTKKNSG